METYFDPDPCEEYLRSCPRGSTISAARLLTLLEESEETDVEGLLEQMEQNNQYLDVTDVPYPEITGTYKEQLQKEKAFLAHDFDSHLLAENDTIKYFLAEIPEHSDIEQERILSESLGNNSPVADKLFRIGLPRALEIAGEYIGRGVTLSDLIQESGMGLWKGIENFQGGDFIQQTETSIRTNLNKVVFYQALSDGIGKHLKQSLSSFQNSCDDLQKTLGRGPSIEEIAQHMQCSVESAALLQKMMDDITIRKAADDIILRDENKAESYEGPIEQTPLYQLREKVSDLLSQLDSLDAEILSLRFGLSDQKPLSTEAIAKKLRLPIEEVMQREGRALRQLRSNN